MGDPPASSFAALISASVRRDVGAICLDGAMVERLHADMAKRTIEIADAIAAMSKG